MVQTAMARVAAADEVPADTGVVEVEVRLGGATIDRDPNDRSGARGQRGRRRFVDDR
ncbi:MAG: hypothetical protein R2755_30990 [Acidimicrobiales bacterium]